MLQVRKSKDRFHTKIDWLDSWHTFSFGEHYDPNHMGFGPLRVINDDRIAGGGGFPTHPHRDMEIVTIVLSGELAHRDSLGTGSVIKPGDVQKMSAGSGIRHSEFNNSKTQAVHLLQIWIMPDKDGIPPAYEQISFEPKQWQNKLCLVASSKGGKDTITLHQDAQIYMADVAEGKTVTHMTKPERNLWLQVATGSVDVNGQLLQEGDGIAGHSEHMLKVMGKTQSKVILFDLGD